MVGHLAAGADRLVRLLDDLLAFTRLQQGAVAVRPVAVDLVPVLHEVLSGFRPQPGGDRLVAALPATLPALADPARVAQATSNMVANALKYAPRGPIRLRASVVPGPPATVRVAVEDHGPGVPESEQGRVWEQFYRGTAATGVAPGMGVGLAVVKALTEAQGGRVGLSSVAGGGSCFWLELPGPGSGPGEPGASTT
jgi:signal transduction histidine kinase